MPSYRAIAPARVVCVAFALHCVLCLGALAHGVSPSLAVYEDFSEAGVFDRWEVTDNAILTSFTWTQANDKLVVQDIGVSTVETWASRILSQDFTELDNFNLAFDFSWSSASNAAAVQDVIVRVVGTDDSVVAMARMHDGWRRHSGGYGATAANGGAFSAVKDTAPLNGQNTFVLSRESSNIEVRIGGVVQVTGNSPVPVDRVEIQLQYYLYNRDAPVTFFGEVAIDDLILTGTFVEPACSGDANDDGQVDVNDISYILFRLGQCP